MNEPADHLPRIMRETISRAVQSSKTPPRSSIMLTCGHLTTVAELTNFKTLRKELMVFCCDHGVAMRGVTLLPPDYAMQEYRRICNSEGPACELGKIVSIPVFGIDCSGEGATRDIVEEDAMTNSEFERCLLLGWNSARNSDSDLIAVGELGAGNTTAAAALASCFLEIPAVDCVGRGSGISQDSLVEKVGVIEAALNRVGSSNDVCKVLRKLGGKEIVAICGAILGAACSGKRIVPDGFVTSVGALAAVKLWPRCRDSLISCVMTDEQGQALIARRLGLDPYIRLGHSCGQGLGGLLTLHLLELGSILSRNLDHSHVVDGLDENVRLQCIGEDFTDSFPFTSTGAVSVDGARSSVH